MRTVMAALAVVGLTVGPGTLAFGDVFNMGGTRDQATGQWTGLASLEFVTVGDPNNAPDTRTMYDGTSGYGSVASTYQIGKYDVTTSQYCQFLNAVAGTDTYRLYSPHMAYTGSFFVGCGILRSGDPGSYTYNVIPGRENFPVNYVSWADAARFVNWLNNGQPTGLQDAATTEAGSYTLNGAIYEESLVNVARSPQARYVIPNLNEQHKAAFYKGGSANAGYWGYPTRSDSIPSNVLDPTGTNNANFYTGGGNYTDPVNFVTPVGAFAGSPGPYGTLDQGGNVSQWHEGQRYGVWRGLRGGAFDGPSISMQATFVDYVDPTMEGGGIGFRVAVVPEPATVILLALGGVLAVRRRA